MNEQDTIAALLQGQMPEWSLSECNRIAAYLINSGVHFAPANTGQRSMSVDRVMEIAGGALPGGVTLYDRQLTALRAALIQPEGLPLSETNKKRSASNDTERLC